MYNIWEELTEEEQDRIIIQNRKDRIKLYIKIDEDCINTYINLIVTIKNVIKKKINKENYTDKDKYVVGMCLDIINKANKDISDLNKDICTLAKRQTKIKKGGK